MPYGQFKSIAEVARTFEIEVTEGVAFTHEITLDVIDALFLMVQENLNDSTNYTTEYAICDALIRPILDIVAKNYTLKVWSHIPYNIDIQKGLVGEPDYLIAPKTKYGTMAKPSLCIIEAKKDNFDEGWTQAFAEMVATSIIDNTVTCYGIVTTGAIWQFGKLENNKFTIDPRYISATTELQRIFNMLNWLFNTISKTSTNQLNNS